MGEIVKLPGPELAHATGPASPRLDRLPLGAVQVLLHPEATQGSLAQLLQDVVTALREVDGIPVDRVSWSLPMLHPQMRSLQLIWTAQTGVRELERSYDDATQAMYARSPMKPLFDGEVEQLRFRLGPHEPRPYDILDELTASGFTDYLAATAPSRIRLERAPTTWATQTAGGFTDAQVDALFALVPVLGLTLGVAAQRRRTRVLLSTYLGNDAAARVLDGHIRRGDVVDVEAAVCFCDLRNFTALSQQLSQQELLGLLDDAFEVIVEAVEAEGGDVLKFIGDAVLAVFRDDDDESTRQDAVERAFRASRTAIQRAEARNRDRTAAGKAPLIIGLSIHLGRVAYGNIGAPQRLDFTVIGAAVNLASRLEGMCRVLGHPLVMSEVIAARLTPEVLGPDILVDAGLHTLKGIPDPVRVFGLQRA